MLFSKREYTLALRFGVNLAVALMFVLLFHTAGLVKVKYFGGIIFDFFTLSQINDPIVNLFFCIAFAAILVLAVLSAKRNCCDNKRLRYYFLSTGIVFAAMAVARTYIFVLHCYSDYEGIIVGWGTYMFVLLIAVLLAGNIER